MNIRERKKSLNEKNGKKTIEVRKGKAKKGDVAVFLYGRNILRGKIVKKEEGNLYKWLRHLNDWKLLQ